jgi:isoleucyl-tRNA synthetase
MRRIKLLLIKLYTCLLTISKLGAPIAPFFMDKLYRDLTTQSEDSVHLAEFPISVENYVNKMLESKMQKAQPFIMVLSLRKGNDKGTSTIKGNDSST